MAKHLLVPIDFKPESLAALDYAIKIADTIEADIHLLYVIEIENPLLKMVLTEDQRGLIIEGAKNKLEALSLEKSALCNGTICTRVSQGKIYSQIVESAVESKADLIIMGRKDSSDMVKNFTGTNTLHIIRESNIPVITLKKEISDADCKHILLPLDLSKQVIKQVSNSIQMAQLLSARVSIVSVLPVDSASLEIKYSTRLNDIRTLFEDYKIPCQYNLIKKINPDLYNIFNEHAREVGADLIVIMTQQELNFTQFFIGSKAQEVINKADIPVLSITPTMDKSDDIPDDLITNLLDPINILKY